MQGWDISDNEIKSVEALLLPSGCHFDDDAKKVIRYWESTDVCACPGSGKTTVLLAKLKVIADRMPLDNGSGICVISHTNVAVSEIKAKLGSCSDKLMGYPNFVGTIQSFVDKFITLPYLMSFTSETIHIVDDRTYAQHIYGLICRRGDSYITIKNLIKFKCRDNGTNYSDIIDYVKGLYICDGNLYHSSQKHPVATETKPSASQYKAAKQELLKTDGMLTYDDSYQYALQALSERIDLSSLLSKRFRYVFIDEYQDCSQNQRDVLAQAFDETICSVFRIGDPDQAIYNSDKEETEDWKPAEKVLPIESSNRYSQEIADILCPLRTSKTRINSLRGISNVKPTVIVYNDSTKQKVIEKFIFLLDKHGLTDPNGIYKAIGWIKKESASGIKIGDYWEDYNAIDRPTAEIKYWSMVDSICEELQQGKLYKTENLIRKLLCRVLFYLHSKAPNGNSYTYYSIKKRLDSKYYDIYRDGLIGLANLSNYNQDNVNKAIRRMINKMFDRGKPIDVFSSLPDYFMEDVNGANTKLSNNNVYNINRRNIQFSTVHKVKGETHDATLYLETEYRGSSDLKRVFPYYNGTTPESSELFNYSRKCVYVGFSRPKKLLCVAMHEKTYKTIGDAFRSWDIYFC